MDNANKIISFVLGLVVVIVFLAVLTGKFKLSSLGFLSNKAKTSVTPTVTPTPKTTAISSVSESSGSQTAQSNAPAKVPVSTTTNTNGANTVYTNNTSNIKTIPNTGAPTILLPIIFSSLFGGIFLKKKGE